VGEGDYDFNPGDHVPKMLALTARVVKEWKPWEAVRGDSVIGKEELIPRKQWGCLYTFVQAPREEITKTFKRGIKVAEGMSREEAINVQFGHSAGPVVVWWLRFVLPLCLLPLRLEGRGFGSSAWFRRRVPRQKFQRA